VRGLDAQFYAGFREIARGVLAYAVGMENVPARVSCYFALGAEAAKSRLALSRGGATS
jgi:hypothetical protein